MCKVSLEKFKFLAEEDKFFKFCALSNKNKSAALAKKSIANTNWRFEFNSNDEYYAETYVLILQNKITHIDLAPI